MTKYIYSGAVTLLLLGAMFAPTAYATTTTPTTVFEQIKTLMAKIAELQSQLATLRGDVHDIIKDGLSEGMTDDDIKEIQELLASDPTIYPEGRITGYFGPMTKEAIKRFQARHELEITGTIDDETKDLMEEYFKERYGGKVPSGLMRAPGIMKKVQDRFALRCDDSRAMGPFCKEIKSEHGSTTASTTNNHREDRGRDRNEHASTTSTTTYNVIVDVVSGTTTVSFTFNGTGYEINVGSTDDHDVIAAVADKLTVSVRNLNRGLKSAIERALDKELTAIENEDNDN